MDATPRADMESPVPVAAEARAGIGRHLGLSGRLFLVTIAFVALVEILIYVPTVANYRRMWLSEPDRRRADRRSGPRCLARSACLG